MISDELREFADAEVLSAIQISDLKHMAKRIDSEMVELPHDRDGAPIHVGDTVCVAGRGNVEFKVDHITFFEDRTRVVADGKGEFAYSKPTDLTHVRHDSWERIADELDEFRKDFANSCKICANGEDTLHDLAERICKLAEKEKK